MHLDVSGVCVPSGGFMGNDRERNRPGRQLHKIPRSVVRCKTDRSAVRPHGAGSTGDKLLSLTPQTGAYMISLLLPEAYHARLTAT